MAEAGSVSSTNGGNPREDISDICGDLKELQDHQARLVEQVNDLTRTLSTLCDVQSRVNERVAARAERCLVLRSTESCNIPAGVLKPVATARSQTVLAGTYLQFNAGPRLVNISELLEMILLELPSEHLLFAQRTSRQFRKVIAQSRPLQQRLFLDTLSTDAILASTILNPIITKEQTLPHVPLYFDKNTLAMAYCHGDGRERVYCTSAAVERDQTSKKEWIDLRLTNKFFPTTSNFWSCEARQGPFGAGSWKQMCLSQPPCEVRWHLEIMDERDRRFGHRFSGTFFGESTMDVCLEAFAASVVVDEGQHRRSAH